MIESRPVGTLFLYVRLLFVAKIGRNGHKIHFKEFFGIVFECVG
jgi:hypothetical protein